MTALKIRNRNEISLGDGGPSSNRYSDHIVSSLHYSNMVESVITLRNMTKDGIALIVPVYNDIELLQDFLDAIKEQTTVPDIIVVDNGSSHDLSGTLANRNEVTVIVRLKNNYGSSGGYYAGMYFAMKNNYKFIILSDVDAIPVSPDLIEREIEMLERGYGYVSSNNVIYNANGIYTGILKESSVPAQYLAIKTEILQKAGLYDPCFYFGNDDSDLCLRLRKYGRFALIRGVTYLHYFNNQEIRALGFVFPIRNLFLYNLRWRGRLFALFAVLRNNFFLWLYSTICNSSLFRSAILGTRIFLGNIMGGVKDVPQGNVSLFLSQFTTRPLTSIVEFERKVISSLDLRIITRVGRTIQPVRGSKLLYSSAYSAYVSMWDQFVFANLNPRIKVIRRIDFDPNRKQIMQFEFHSTARVKAMSWFRLIVNAPFFLSLVPVLILGAMLFKDHDKGVHD